MSETKSTFKTVSAVFIALTVIFGASTGYLLTNPNTITQTQTVAITTTGVASVSSPLYSINVAYSPSLGFYLTNSTGWTLYVLTRDIPANGTSRCTGKCIQNWPAFHVSQLNLPPGLNATDFTTITRPDGSKQTAYNGWPLYTFINDKKPGDINGQGIQNVWFASTVPKLKLTM